MRKPILYLLALAAWPAAVFAQPVVAFDTQDVTITGITAGGKVAALSIARQPVPWMIRIVPRRVLLTDADGDGTITLSLDEPLPQASIWAVVDITTGAYTVASPEGFDLEQLVLDETEAFGPSGGRAPILFVPEQEQLELLGVRPGVGAWVFQVIDGTEQDRGGRADKRIVVALNKMLALAGDQPGFGGADPGDVVIGINPNKLQFFAVERTK